MDIILWRHAEAEDVASSDLARRLTPRGEKQAARMATWLISQLGHLPNRASPWRVVASPALRAQETAAALCMPVETNNALAPDGSVDAVFRAAGWPDNASSVIVVGHQPTLGMVAGRLINGADGYVSVKKGALWWFRQRERDGESQAVLVAMATPESVGDPR